MPVDGQGQHRHPGIELPGSFIGQPLDQHGWHGEKGVGGSAERVSRHARQQHLPQGGVEF
jgi:hypothetical protein